MIKYFVKSLLLVLVSFFIFACSKVHISEITSFSQIPLAQINKDTLILVDIDETIFRSTSYYGSVKYFEDLYYQEKPKNKYTHAQLDQILVKLWEESQEKVSIELVDPNFPIFLNQAIKNSTILALTKRELKHDTLTRRQLAKYNLSFSKVNNFQFIQDKITKIFPDESWCRSNSCQNIREEFLNAKAGFLNGIIYVHDLNSKGEIFSSFYLQYIKYLKQQNLKAPKSIILVDDKLSNINSVITSLDSSLNFYGYHIVAASSKQSRGNASPENDE